MYIKLLFYFTVNGVPVDYSSPQITHKMINAYIHVYITKLERWRETIYYN